MASAFPRRCCRRVFNMFTQVGHSAGSRQGGLGIGLTLVRRLVEMHKGRVEAFSEGANKGSEFVIHLPLAQMARRIFGPTALPTRICTMEPLAPGCEFWSWTTISIP